MHLGYLTVLLMGMMQSALFACLPWLIDHTPLDVMEWSWLIGVSLFGFVLLAPVWGRVTDRYGALITLRLSFTGFTVALLILLLPLVDLVKLNGSASVVVCLLILSRLIHGLFASGLFGAAQALVLARSKRDAKIQLARLNAINQLGRMLGPLLVVIAALHYPPLALYVLAFVCVLLVLMPWSRFEVLARASVTSGGALPDQTTVAPAFRWQAAWPELAMASLLTLFVGILQFVLGPYLQWLWSLSSVEATAELSKLLFLSALVITLAALVIVPKLAHAPRCYIAVMVTCLLLGAVFMGGAESRIQWAVAVALVSIGVALCSPYYGVKIRERWPECQGAIGGYLTSAHTVGYGLGTLAGGWLFDAFPERVMWSLSFIAPFIVLCMAFQRRATERLSGK